jgi:hypothetical protein
VVAGGSVVTRQPLLARAPEAQLRLVDAELELRVLAQEPVAGAVVLARRLLGSSLTKAAAGNELDKISSLSRSSRSFPW